MREHCRGDEGGVLDLHAVMDLVAFAQPAQNADRVFDRRLVDHHGLEPPLEGGVLFDVLAVLVKRRGADGVQLAAGEHRLEHVRRVHRALGRAGADHGVQLVDEQDDLTLCVGDFLQHRLEPLFELAAVLGSGDERAHVEGDNALVLQPLGHVAADDACGETFDDGGFADTGLADQNRVVLGAPRQYLDHPADFLVAADHRIELALARQLGQIATVAFERLVGAFGILARHALRAANGGERLEHPIRRDAVLLQQTRGGRAAGFAGDRHEEVLGADVVVLEPPGFRLCEVANQLEPR